MKKQKIKCPRCGKVTDWSGNKFRPFCSEHCRLVDLGNWADEKYTIAGDQTAEDNDEQFI